MQLDWSTKRKITISVILATVLLIGVGILYALFFVSEPTCFDGIRNQNEINIDCGGVCQRLCKEQTADPIVLWDRTFNVDKNMYNVVALVENPNIQAWAENVPYQFRIFDQDNVELQTRTGQITIPPNDTFAIFKGRVELERPPSRTVFTFTDAPQWIRAQGSYDIRNIQVSNKRFGSLDSQPRLDVDITNNSIRSISNIEVVSIIYDNDGNAVGVSRTIIDELDDDETRRVSFTWPKSFDVGNQVCTQPADVMVILDRSGSMNDDNDTPPQPLRDVIESAQTFLEMLANKDMSGLVSFATDATLDASLTSDLSTVRTAIGDIKIDNPDNEQHTNISAGIETAYNELSSGRGNDESAKMIVLLTDGIATRPLPPDGENNDASDKYAQKQALKIADKARADGMEVFVIGLGDSVDKEFLKQLAGDDLHFSFSPTTDDLGEIYEDVATFICRKDPNVTRIFIQKHSR